MEQLHGWSPELMHEQVGSGDRRSSSVVWQRGGLLVYEGLRRKLLLGRLHRGGHEHVERRVVGGRCGAHDIGRQVVHRHVHAAETMLELWQQEREARMVVALAEATPGVSHVLAARGQEEERALEQALDLSAVVLEPELRRWQPVGSIAPRGRWAVAVVLESWLLEREQLPRYGQLQLLLRVGSEREQQREQQRHERRHAALQEAVPRHVAQVESTRRADAGPQHRDLPLRQQGQESIFARARACVCTYQRGAEAALGELRLGQQAAQDARRLAVQLVREPVGHEALQHGRQHQERPHVTNVVIHGGSATCTELAHDRMQVLQSARAQQRSAGSRQQPRRCGGTCHMVRIAQPRQAARENGR